MSAITLSAVSKIYSDGTQALSGVDLDVPDGELLVLVGPSGCGKTTLLRMVAGLESITEGTIAIGHAVVNDVVPKDRDIAMVFQNYALYPHMSVFDNMAFGLKLRRSRRATTEQRVREAARMLGLEDQLQKKPRELSGGQRQRVAMGRAMVRQPQAFLMDEPLSNLDAKLRVQMRAEIIRMQRELGVTTMYVTHDQTEAMTLGDSVAVLRKGLIQQIDNPQALYKRPANLFVAGFVGSPPMNLVEATLTFNGEGAVVRFGSYELRLEGEALAAQPGLRLFDGRSVVLGIRPEDISDAALTPEAPESQRIIAVVDLREELGSDVYAHFEVDARPIVSEDLREIAADADSVRVSDLEDLEKRGRSRFIARLAADTRVEERQRAVFLVDTRHLQFFDPASGLRI